MFCIIPALTQQHLVTCNIFTLDNQKRICTLPYQDCHPEGVIIIALKSIVFHEILRDPDFRLQMLNFRAIVGL